MNAIKKKMVVYVKDVCWEIVNVSGIECTEFLLTQLVRVMK